LHVSFEVSKQLP